MARPETVLVTGATGYIGGRLAPLLVEEGRSVRVLVRGETRARSRPWSDQVDVVTGDVFNLKPSRKRWQAWTLPTT